MQFVFQPRESIFLRGVIFKKFQKRAIKKIKNVWDFRFHVARYSVLGDVAKNLYSLFIFWNNFILLGQKKL